MKMNFKKTVAAAVVLMGMAPSAFAAQQLDNKSLTDVLISKGVLTADDVKAMNNNKNGKLTLEALLYLNTYHQKADTTTAAGTTSTKTTGLAVDRAYFTAKYFFDKNWMMRITLDAGNDQSLTGKKQNVFLKAAYVEGKLVGDAVVLRLGQSHTPWIDYEQGLWKHRYVAQVMTDVYKFDDSFDLGVGLKGKLADGLVQYFVTETNGTGYANAARSGSVDFNSRIGIYPIEGLTLDFQFRDGNRGTKTTVASVTTAGVKSTLMQAMVTYGTKDFRIGGNYINNSDKANSAITSTLHHGGYVSSGYNMGTLVANDKLKSTAFGIWGWTKFPGTDFGAFGRYENMKIKLNSGTVNEKLTRFMAGLEYNVIKGVDISLVTDNFKLKSRGGVAANQRKDTRYGLYSQIAF
jgi:hypothetical protein